MIISESNLVVHVALRAPLSPRTVSVCGRDQPGRMLASQQL